jgi:AraC-like DNA-binding protein/ligand-binding sensor protein
VESVQAAANKKFIEQLSRSQIFQDYERAFSKATGLPLSLRGIETWQPVHRGKKNENPFCALMATKSKACAACLEMQARIAQTDGECKTLTCFAGLCDTAVPIRIGHELIGYLQTGQILTKKPTRAKFARVAKQIVKWGLGEKLGRIEDAYFHTRVITSEQYQAMVRLLVIFGQHLSAVSNQLLVRQRNAEPPVVTRAREFIKEHQADDLSLGEVARAVNTSSFYFCKLFKKATGLNFTDYLSRIRIEKAKNLLLNPNLRVSEIAYAVGFQSLTHFNRVFKRIVGQSPKEFRKKLAIAQ